MPYPVGIDLGTTNSVVCIWRRGAVETIPVEGQPVMPSAVSVRQDGAILVGQTAKSRAMIDPDHSVLSVKRSMGDTKARWDIYGKTYTPADISALILGRLKTEAGRHLGEKVTEAVITVPAYFNNNQKQDTRFAGEKAGFRVLQLMAEPTAAAISYGLDKGKDQILMVYDLGGGTFDVSVLAVKGNRFVVKAVDGDFHLGGDDFDLRLVDHIIGLLQKRTKRDLGALRSSFSGGRKKGAATAEEMLMAQKRLKEAAERAKIELSQSETARVSLPEILGTSLDEEITLATYNGLVSPLVERTIEKIRDVLKAAKLKPPDIDRLILVGGSTRNRLVKERVAEAVKDPWTSERVDEVVGQGAAIVACHLSAPDEDMAPIEFTNVTPFSLGVCSYEREGRRRYVNSIIIRKDSPVPCVEARPYELQTQPGQKNQLEVYMLQGEDEDPAKCLVLGKYVFSDVSHAPSSMAKVEIKYGYDDSGIITVNARDLGTDRELPLSIEPLPEDMSWVSRPPAGGRFDPSALKLIVTPPGYDDVGTVLKELHLPFKLYREGDSLSGCDIFFWNCLADDHPDEAEISEYVCEGGCLYASCCAAGEIGSAFPGSISFTSSGCRTETITAEVLDNELAAILGRTMRIKYDMAACYAVKKTGRGAKVLLREARSRREVMVMAPFGKGHVFYTCFHHHKNISADEKKLLRVLVMKQISVVSGIPMEIVSEQISG